MQTRPTIHLFILSVFIILFSAAVPGHSQPDEFVRCHQVKQRIASSPVTQEQIRRARASLERSDTFDILHYTIALDVTRFSQEQLHASTKVVFTPKMEEVDLLNLDLEGLNVDSVYSASDSLAYDYNGRLLSVHLPKPLSPVDTMEIYVDYHGKPITCPSGFGGFYFEEGYAYNLGIGLQAEPHNFGRSWFPCFDNFVERSTYEYRVLSNQGRKAYCVGNFVEEQKIGQDSFLRTYEMNQPIPSYLSHVAISNYTAVRMMYPTQYHVLPIRLVSSASDTSNFKSSFSALGEALECFEYWYGPYAFEQVGFTITPRGAMEHPTAVAFPETGISNGDLNIDLMAHELCHHWWGNVVTLETAADMWIKEGPASYGEHLLREYLYGDQALTNAVRNNNHFVIHNAHVQDGGYLPLSPMPEDNTYGTHTYRRGALVLHNLRSYMGDSLFREGMKYVLKQRKFGNIDAGEFRLLLEEKTGLDLGPFFNDWVYAPGWVDFEIDSLLVVSEQPSNTTVRIYLEQKLYHAPDFHQSVPLKIAFYNDDFERVIRTVHLNGQFSQVEVELPFSPTAWYINPDQHLNIASFNSHHIVTEAKEYDFPQDLLTTTVESITDSALIAVEHHYSAPDQPDSDNEKFRLSTAHYWNVKIHPEDQIHLRGNYRYTASGSYDFEQELTENSEDSLVVMYRPHAGAPWIEYPHYRKTVFIPGDGNGFINIDSMLSGQYALANARAPLSSDEVNEKPKALAVYPNPASKRIQIDIPDRFSGTVMQLTILDLEGKEMFRRELGDVIRQVDIPITDWNNGMYYIQLGRRDGRDKLFGSFIKQ